MNMKSMRVMYDDTEGLTNLINEVYFGNGNSGKIPEEFDQKLKLETSVLKTILSDLECEVKVENEIIDGTMKFKTLEDGENLYLIPTSHYCIKKDEDKEFYSFY